MEARDPVQLVSEIKSLLTSEDTRDLGVIAVANALLTPSQRLARDAVRLTVEDARTEQDYRKVWLHVAAILRNAPYVPPELYWLDVITPIAKVES